VGRKAGLTQRQLLEINEYRSSDAFTDAERAVLALADAITSTPVHIDEAVWRPIRSALSDEQIVELVSAVAWENYRARSNHALGIESQHFAEGSFCAMPERGPDAANG
jgi:alkylhydroperoxidase family enzyme